jgi:hypothetical protein
LELSFFAFIWWFASLELLEAQSIDRLEERRFSGGPEAEYDADGG